MLQMTVCENPGNHYIQAIGKDGQVLSVYDEEKKKIDLSPFEPYVGEPITITYITKSDEGQYTIKYQKETVLEEYGTMPYGIQYLSYSKAVDKSTEEMAI